MFGSVSTEDNDPYQNYDKVGLLVASGDKVVRWLRIPWPMPDNVLLPFMWTKTGKFGESDWCADIASLLHSKDSCLFHDGV